MVESTYWNDVVHSGEYQPQPISEPQLGGYIVIDSSFTEVQQKFYNSNWVYQKSCVKKRNVVSDDR